MEQIMLRRRFCGLFAPLLVITNIATAAEIDVLAFGPDAVVQDFSTLSLGSIGSPLMVDGVTFSTNAAGFEVQSIINSTSRLLSTPFSLSEQRYIDTTFAEAVPMAGLWIGSSQTYLGTVSFYDADAGLLGSVSIPFTGGGDLRFAGWQADGAPIARIHAVVATNSPTRITNVISQVPEPTSTTILLGAAIVILYRRRHGANAHCC